MKAGEQLSLEQIQAFLEASEEVEFEGRERGEMYEWINRMLRQIRYGFGETGPGKVRIL